MGQLALLKHPLPGTAAFSLSPVPCAAQALVGKDSLSHQPYGELCAGTALSMDSSGGISLPAALSLAAALLTQGDWGSRPGALARKLVKRRKTEIKV